MLLSTRSAKRAVQAQWPA